MNRDVQTSDTVATQEFYVVINGKCYLVGPANFVPLPSDSDDELEEQSFADVEVEEQAVANMGWVVFEGPNIVGHNSNLDPHTLNEIITGILGLMVFALVIPSLLYKFWL